MTWVYYVEFHCRRGNFYGNRSLKVILLISNRSCNEFGSYFVTKTLSRVNFGSMLLVHILKFELNQLPLIQVVLA